MADYINEAELRAAFVAWQAEREANPGTRVPLPDPIVEAANLICDRLLEMPSYSGYTYDLRSGGLLHLVKYGRSYRPQFKAFQFLTMLLRQGFHREIELERKQRGAHTIAITDTSENYLASPGPDDAPEAPPYGVFATLPAGQLHTILKVARGYKNRSPHVLAVCSALNVSGRDELLVLLARHGAAVPAPIEHRPAPSMKRLGKELRALAGV